MKEVNGLFGWQPQEELYTTEELRKRKEYIFKEMISRDKFNDVFWGSARNLAEADAKQEFWCKRLYGRRSHLDLDAA